jgi:polysaccharide export outer membrane protein
MKSKILFLFVLSICLAQFTFGQTIPVDVQTPRGYLVGPNDVLKISVLGEPQFEVLQATVDEDGKIQIPFSDEGVMAKCRTEKQLKADISQLLSKYLKNPQVSVNVLQRNNRPPAIVFGEVRQPMQYTLTRRTRLLDLISSSGGVTEDAGGIIQVYRLQAPMCSEEKIDSDWTAEMQNSEVVPSRMYSYSNLRKGSDEANPIINPGDVIVVHKALPVYITGEVNSPQGVYIKEGGLSLMEAVGKISGIKPEAKTKDIKIYRLKPNSKDRDIISVNFDLIKKGKEKDVMLEPYDIVEVDKSKKSIKQIAFEMATGLGRTALTGIGGSIPNRILY